mgnify:CR=1 FL=1
MRRNSEYMAGSAVRRVRPSVLICGVVVWFLVGMCLAYKPLVSEWHFYQMERSYQRALRMGPTPEQGEALRAYIYHRDRLVELGRLEERVFPLRHINPRTETWREFWQKAQDVFPEHYHVALRESAGGHSLELVVWDTPERMRTWEEFVHEHDMPDGAVLSENVETSGER